MRKSCHRLYALARQGLQQDPLNGQLFAFINRRPPQIKVLYFDRSGWCLWANRLEAGRFIGNWRELELYKKSLYATSNSHFTQWSQVNISKDCQATVGLWMDYGWATKQNAHMKWAFATSLDGLGVGCAGKI